MSRLKSLRAMDGGNSLEPDDFVHNYGSSSLVNHVLQPLEEKMQQYDVLMHQSHQQKLQLDEEIRLMQERRSLALERFMVAKAKHDEYERQHQDVSKVLQGESEPEFHPKPMKQLVRAESFDDEPQLEHEILQPTNSMHLEPSRHLTYHQIFYIFILDGIGGMLISGGVNFGLAYAMYTTQDTVKNPIRLFQLPNTLAGDGAVTIIIQCILTWFIEKGLVAHDLSRRGVQPIGFISEPTSPWLRWLLFLPSTGYDKAFNDVKGEPQLESPAQGFAAVLSSALQEALRGFLFAIVGFVLLWPASIGILVIFGKQDGWDYTYADRWIPQFFKLFLGGILGLLTTPFMAMFWLIKAGWEGDLYQELNV